MKIKVVCVYAHSLLYLIQDYGVVVWFLFSELTFHTNTVMCIVE